MMNLHSGMSVPEVIGEILREVGITGGGGIVPDYSDQLVKLTAHAEDIAKSVASLEDVADVVKESAEKLLKNEVIEVLQIENAKLQKDASVMARRVRMYKELLEDQGKRCISCRKEPGESHKEGCDWAPATPEALDELNAEVEETP